MLAKHASANLCCQQIVPSLINPHSQYCLVTFVIETLFLLCVEMLLMLLLDPWFVLYLPRLFLPCSPTAQF